MKIQIMGGTVIDDACREAALVAWRHEKDVSFDFNGVTVVAKPTRTIQEREKHTEELVAGWRGEMDRKSKTWTESPEYAREQLRIAAEITELQTRHDALVKEIPGAGAGHRVWLTWLMNYAEVVDRIGVRHDFEFVEEKMKAAGYSRNDECVPPGLSAEESLKYGAILKLDPDRMARWIAGQAIDGMRAGPGPHPVVRSFVVEWLGLAKRRTRNTR